jgi:NAD(P)H dehydrogenase (quinone)
LAEILVLFHSATGATFRVAQSVAEGVADIPRCNVTLKQIAEIVDPDSIYGPGAAERRAEFADIPVVDPAELERFDGIAFGTPVHIGAPSAAFAGLLAGTGQAWMAGSLTGKPATVFATGGSGSGREAAILSIWTSLATHGMTIVPLGTRAKEIQDLTLANGANSLGAGTLTSAPGEGDLGRPTTAEQAAARAQGRALAEVVRAWTERDQT